MKNELLYISGNDIPFEQAKVIIHQPTVKEIAYIGEKNFFVGCQFLNFSKENIFLQNKDNFLSEDLNDFKILMTIVRQNNAIAKSYKNNMNMVLALIFPDYQIDFLPLSIRLLKDNESFFIDENNFDAFKNILKNMFCLTTTQNSKYNPGGPQAAALVKKFQERAKKLARLKNQDEDQVNILSEYISILAVGEQKNMNQLLQYTVYQLQNEIRRFRAKEGYDMYVQARMAGAQNLQEVEHWMKKMSTD